MAESSATVSSSTKYNVFSSLKYQILLSVTQKDVSLTSIAIGEYSVTDCTALWWVDDLDLLRRAGAHDHGFREDSPHLGWLQVTEEHSLSLD